MVQPSAKNAEVANHPAHPVRPTTTLCASYSGLGGGLAEDRHCHHSYASSFLWVLLLRSHAGPWWALLSI